MKKPRIKMDTTIKWSGYPENDIGMWLYEQGGRYPLTLQFVLFFRLIFHFGSEKIIHNKLLTLRRCLSSYGAGNVKLKSKSRHI